MTFATGKDSVVRIFSKTLLLSLTMLGLWLITACHSQKKSASVRENVNWAEIDTFFTPPPSLAGNFGSFRSPLEYYNGGEGASAD